MHKLTKIVFFYLFIIIFLGIFLRLWKLTEFPIHLSHDEVSQAYDAISIVETGRDVYGNFLPTIFPSVNDFKSPFYTYATSVVYFLIGNHEWMIRIPGVIFGILIIPAIFWFSLKLTKEPKIALFASFFTAIGPSEIFFSRKSFENMAGIFFIFIAFSFLLTFLEEQKKLRWLYLATLFSAFGMYTYFSHVIIIPLMLLTFILTFRKKLSGGFNKYSYALILWILLITPILFIIFTNPGARYRSETVFIKQDVKLGEYLNFINYPNSIFSQLMQFKILGDFSFNRYLQQFDPMFLFVTGLDLTNQGPLNAGPLLMIQLPLLILGIYFISKRSDLNNAGKLLGLWILLAALPSGLTFEPHSPHRMVIVFTILNIATGIGAYFLWEMVGSLKRRLKLILTFVIVTILTINLTYFLHIYFVNYPYEKSQYIQYPFKQVAQFAWSQYQNYDLIVFDPLFGEDAPFVGTAAHYYLAYFGNYPPAKFQKEYKIGSREREAIFDKFSIRKIDWREDQNLKNTLLIGSGWSLPIESIDKNKIINTFHFYNGQAAFYAIKL